MRKPRDYDAELKALGERTRQLKERRVVQIGELVIACGADALPLEQLAGVMLDAAGNKDAAAKEAWRVRGTGFFQQRAARSGRSDQREPAGAPASNGSAPAAGSEPGA